LQFLHSNKLIHRDIKPANILCSSEGFIKIADFGISKALDKTAGFANSFVGTVCYMSPERITGESYNYSCDIWSLGLTLLAVAKGRFPIGAKREKTAIVVDEEDKTIIANYNNEENTLDSNSDVQPIGGPKGYWAMIQAVCDEEPPMPGPKFSKDFNDFIYNCLQKQPDDRMTVVSSFFFVFVFYFIVFLV